jgi:ketosteroid isomerase-like protein
MKKVITIAALGLLLSSLDFQNMSAAQDIQTGVVEQLKKATQELLDAVAPGQTAVWQKYLAEDCVYTDEEGNIKTKEDLLKELRPLPQGYVGSIKMGEPRVVIRDAVIVLTHRDREELTLYGQKLITWFHSTDTWAKQPDGQWKLAALHVTVIPNERKPMALDPKTAARTPQKLDAYVGQYQTSPEASYLITREGDKLFGQRKGRDKEELLPLYADVFYRKGVWRGEKVFERDAKGKVVRMLDRRDNNDLVWEKVK